MTPSFTFVPRLEIRSNAERESERISEKVPWFESVTHESCKYQLILRQLIRTTSQMRELLRRYASRIISNFSNCARER